VGPKHLLIELVNNKCERIYSILFSIHANQSIILVYQTTLLPNLSLICSKHLNGSYLLCRLGKLIKEGFRMEKFLDNMIWFDICKKCSI